jgi:hypothetical protein
MIPIPILEYFITMLQQMAVYFSVGQIQSVVYYWSTGLVSGFMLVMDNGEYWYCTNINFPPKYELFKYPPPLPASSDLRAAGVLMPGTVIVVASTDDVLNEYVRRNGGGESHYLDLDNE